MALSAGRVQSACVTAQQPVRGGSTSAYMYTQRKTKQSWKGPHHTTNTRKIYEEKQEDDAANSRVDAAEES